VKTVILPASLPDGSGYQPLLIVDATTSVGVAVTTDRNGAIVARLVLRRGTAVRAIRTYAGQLIPTVVGVYLVSGQLYWLETLLDFTGHSSTSVWRAAIAGGPARRIAHDRSAVLFFDSDFDLELHGNRLYWAASGPNNGGEIWSVALSGGPETVRRFDQRYTLTTWPWLTTSAESQPGPIRLLNRDTGIVQEVSARPNEILNCTPAWCRVTALTDNGKNLAFHLQHPDGSAGRRLNQSMTPLNTDVGLLDRFEVVASPLSTNGSTDVRLWLHDLTDDRDVLLADVASGNVGSRGNYLWWSTGDNEVTVWHILDLRKLRL
jgi:hypothetical protein